MRLMPPCLKVMLLASSQPELCLPQVGSKQEQCWMFLGHPILEWVGQLNRDVVCSAYPVSKHWFGNTDIVALAAFC